MTIGAEGRHPRRVTDRQCDDQGKKTHSVPPDPDGLTPGKRQWGGNTAENQPPILSMRLSARKPVQLGPPRLPP